MQIRVCSRDLCADTAVGAVDRSLFLVLMHINAHSGHCTDTAISISRFPAPHLPVARLTTTPCIPRSQREPPSFLISVRAFGSWRMLFVVFDPYLSFERNKSPLEDVMRPGNRLILLIRMKKVPGIYQRVHLHFGCSKGKLWLVFVPGTRRFALFVTMSCAHTLPQLLKLSFSYFSI